MAELSTANINDLPDSDFAYIEPGGKVVDGKTEPRSLRHFPIHDAAHVRNALARASQSPFGAKAMPKIKAAARKFGIDEPPSKAMDELKAEPMTTGQLDRWLKGLIPRRLLAVPFGGPIPSPRAPLGVDIDGEWFSDRTDLFDGHKALLASRDRLVDWHHDLDPTGVMKGAILGRLVLDEYPETEGYWSDYWANAGEARLKLVAQLEERGTKLYGSSQAAYKKADPLTGELLTWPMVREAISTSPQNTLAIMPSLKAVLAADVPFDDVGLGALKAALLGIDDLGDDLAQTSEAGDAAAKAGRVLSSKNEERVRRAHAALSAVDLAAIAEALADVRELAEAAGLLEAGDISS